MKFVISAVFGCLLSAAVVAASELNNLSSEVISSSASGMTIAVEMPDPTFRVLARGDDLSALAVEIEAAIPNFDEAGVALPEITKLIAVPQGYRVVARVRNAETAEFSTEAFIARDRMQRSLRAVGELPTVEVGEAGWMRWMRVAPVVIRPASYNQAEGRIQIATRLEIEFDFVPDGTESVEMPDPGRYWSQDYELFFQGMLLNPRELPNILPGGSMVTRGSYIIVTDSALANKAMTRQFVEWKRSKGFDVVVNPMYRQGISAEEIRTYIQNAFDTWERPPEYVMLLGDVNAPGIQLPTFRIANPAPGVNEIDVTDHPYSLMMGDDYFPDIFIGRVSSDSPSSSFAETYFSRLIRHERDALAFSEEAFNRAVLFAGNRGDGGEQVLSPVETTEWLAERLRERGMDVFTSFWRQAGDNESPEPIIEAINRGCNMVAYRGWADANGTHFPRFYKEHLERLNNGPLLPLASFFVCNTGDFGNEQHSLCFGEYGISRGTRPNPTGFIGFYGPSDLHTNTRYNNAMLAGYYHGILYQGNRTFGAITLRAKMEVWRSNPAQRVQGGNSNFVEFYFSTYNIMGDPELNYWLDYPTRLDVIAPAGMSVGGTDARFIVRTEAGVPVRGALIHLRKGDETNLSILTDQNGEALAPVNLVTADTLRATILAHQCAPVLLKIPVVESNRMIGFESVVVSNDQGNDRLIPGVEVTLTPSLRNFGDGVANGVTAVLTSPLGGVEVLQGSSEFGNIAAAGVAAAQSPYRIVLRPDIASGSKIPFVLQIREGENTYSALFRLQVSNSAVTYQGHTFETESLDPGETEDIVVSVYNWGPEPIEGLRAVMHSFDNAVEIVDAEAVFGDVASGGRIDCEANPFRIGVDGDAAVGRQVALRVELMNSDDEMIGKLFFSIVIGNPGPTDPVGPDGYGYYAYDDVDEGYAQHPTYEWIELDSAFGGVGGTHVLLTDDQSFQVDLPFPFRFYGEEYGSVAICSNGWMSFEETEVWDFNNWPIPSPLGPHAMICPFWEDLIGPNNKNDIKVVYRHDSEQGRFIIEWSRAIGRSGNDVNNEETFEVILFDPEVRQTRTGDGEILIQYKAVAVVDRGRDLNYATVGIQDWNHFKGIELTYAGTYTRSCEPLRAERAILFTTDRPDDFLGASKDENTVPTAFRVGEPFPNPFNARTVVDFDMPAGGEVSAAIYDLSGRQLLEIASGRYEAGRHRLEFGLEGLPSGMYLLRLEAAGSVRQRKLTLLK